MRRTLGLIFALALVVAACSSGSGGDSSEEEPSTTAQATTTVAETTTTTTTAATTTSTTTQVVTTTTDGEDSNLGSPLVVVSVSFDALFIQLRNDGDEDYDISGHWLCNRPSYFQLPGQVLSPGDVIEIDVRSLGMNPDSGELALYTSGDFGSSADIIRYVQWGTDSHGRTSVAVAGGVWPEGDFVDNQGGNLESTGSNPVSSADWSSG